MSWQKRLTQTTAGAVVLCAAVVAVNIIFSRLNLRADVTADKIYSLSSGSRNIAKGLTSEVSAKLYYSKSARDVPVSLKTYGNRVAEVLREYAAASGGKLRVEVIDPRPDTDDEEWARKYGIQSAPTGNGEELYLGVAFFSGDKEAVIPFLDPRKEEFLEYELSEALLKLRTAAKPQLGVMTALPVQGGADPRGQASSEWVLLTSLKNSFEITTVGVEVEEISSSINTMLVLHPKSLSDKTQWALDQFVMRGGRLIVAVDPFSRVDLAMSQSPEQGGQMPQTFSNLEKLFAAWGIVYNPQEIVGDPLVATRINVGGEVVTYPFFVTLDKDHMNSTAKISSHLRQMTLAESGAVDVKADSGLKMEPLLSTSDDSGAQNSMMFQFMNPLEIAGAFKTDGKKRHLAALYSGTFKSAFAAGAPEGVTATPIAASKEDGLVLVVADVDFLHDSNSVDKMQFGPQVIVRPRNDNLNFILNAAEFLGGSQDLISIRSSGKVARPFTRVLALQKSAQAKWKEEEESLSKELNDLQKTLGRLQSERTDGNQASLTPEQNAEIQRFRDQEVDIRKRRREVRKNLREDIEALGHRLVALNLLVVPVLVGLFGFVVFRRREQRARGVSA